MRRKVINVVKACNEAIERRDKCTELAQWQKNMRWYKIKHDSNFPREDFGDLFEADWLSPKDLYEQFGHEVITADEVFEIINPLFILQFHALYADMKNYTVNQNAEKNISEWNDDLFTLVYKAGNHKTKDSYCQLYWAMCEFATVHRALHIPQTFAGRFVIRHVKDYTDYLQYVKYYLFTFC